MILVVYLNCIYTQIRIIAIPVSGIVENSE
jgi:hypothetical protein